MNNNAIPHTNIYKLKPHALQWFITFLPHIILTIAGVVYAGMEDMPFTNIVLGVSVVLACYLAYQLVYLQSIIYNVSKQQIITTFGVFYIERNYLELYRIVDFRESQTVMQRLVGLKTITIYSTDRNTPRLFVIGVKSELDLVGSLRQLVYENRKRMGIHEFTNYQ